MSGIQTLVRLPADLKAWVVTEAKRNGSSVNSEVIRAIRERVERSEKQNTTAAD